MVRACEASLRRPLALAWHIDGVAVLSVPAQLKKRVREVKYPDGTFVYAIKQDKKTAYGVLPRHPEQAWSESKNRLLPPPQQRRCVDEHDLCAELGGLVTDADWFDRLARHIFDNEGGMVTGPGGVGKTQGLLKAFKKLAGAERPGDPRGRPHARRRAARSGPDAREAPCQDAHQANQDDQIGRAHV